MQKSITVLIKPASSLCNLRCRYCFYNDVSENRDMPSTGIMNENTIEVLGERLHQALGHSGGTANISFQGGEPTVAGLSFFKTFTNVMAKQHPEIKTNYSIQTNATLLDDDWAAFFHEHNFLVGVSLDGFESNMNNFRYDTEHQSVYYKVLKGIELLKKHNVEYNILTVVTSDLAKHPKALFDFYLSHHFDYVQLIPCLPGLAEKENDMSLTPEHYASFFNTIFDCWIKAIKKHKVININLFDNLASMLQGMSPYQCGMLGKCQISYIIEANGDVYPCDFYCLDQYKLGNIHLTSFKEMKESRQAESFLHDNDCFKELCHTCRYEKICHGGCRRQNICWMNKEYCAYNAVLDHVLPVLDDLLVK